MEIMNSEYGKEIPVTRILNSINESIQGGQLTEDDYVGLKEYFEGLHSQQENE